MQAQPRQYPVKIYLLFFYIFSIGGWLWEEILFLFTENQFINRGFLHGPWLPVYGAASVLILLVFSRRRGNPAFAFAMIVIVSGVVEYMTAWYLERFHHAKWWDYSGYRFHLHGRISLLGLFVFGAGGCLVLYVLAPLLGRLFKRVQGSVLLGIGICLTIIFAVDWFYSLRYPNLESAENYLTFFDKASTLVMNLINAGGLVQTG